MKKFDLSYSSDGWELEALEWPTHDLPVEVGDIISYPNHKSYEPGLFRVYARPGFGSTACLREIDLPQIPALDDTPPALSTGHIPQKVKNPMRGTRYLWIVELPLDSQVEAWELKDGELSKTTISCLDLELAQKLQEEMEAHNYQLREERSREAIEKELGNWDAALIRQFNKSPFCGIVPDGFLGLKVKITSCGNWNVLVVRAQRTLRVPDNLKGLVIGRKGQHIKKLSKMAGFRITVK